MRKYIFALISAFLSIAPVHAQLVSQQTWVGTFGGTSNVLTASVHNIVALNDILGVPIRGAASGVNTTAVTLQINLDSGGNLGAIAVKKLQPSGLTSMTGCELRTGQEATFIYDGTEFVAVTNYSNPAPTYTHLTVGTGTYTPPTCATSLEVRLLGGGGGGGGGGTPGNSGQNGSNGVLTSLGSFTAAPGQFGFGGGSANGFGGAGGTGGSGSATARYQGGGGGFGGVFLAATVAFGGAGGASCLGGGGLSTGVSGGQGAANTGAGGAGGASSTSSGVGGGGGGAAECVQINIPPPLAANYSYSVGTGGTSGAAGNGSIGGVGGTGDILIKELYN